MSKIRSKYVSLSGNRKSEIDPVTFGTLGNLETFTDKKEVIDQWDAEIKPFAKNANDHVQRLHKFLKKQD
jgi:hypothetical protein